jgi:hypothetical protein
MNSKHNKVQRQFEFLVDKLLPEHLDDDRVYSTPIWNKNAGSCLCDNWCRHIPINGAAVNAIRTGTQDGKDQSRP